MAGVGVAGADPIKLGESVEKQVPRSGRSGCSVLGYLQQKGQCRGIVCYAIWDKGVTVGLGVECEWGAGGLKIGQANRGEFTGAAGSDSPQEFSGTPCARAGLG